MKSYIIHLWVMSLCFYGLSIAPLRAQSSAVPINNSQERWSKHPTKDQYNYPQQVPNYHTLPTLKPSKQKTHNTLRRKGWQTHPDPYIEEGGVYTSSIHPAVKDSGSIMRYYTNETPSTYTPPPATVLNPYSSHNNSQQKVQITDPSTNNNPPPILLPPQ